MYLNCGLTDTKTPQGMARALRKIVIDLPSKLRVASKSFWLELFQRSGNKYQRAMAKAIAEVRGDNWFLEDKAEDLGYIIDSYKTLLDRMPKEQGKPIIIIGE